MTNKKIRASFKKLFHFGKLPTNRRREIPRKYDFSGFARAADFLRSFLLWLRSVYVVLSVDYVRRKQKKKKTNGRNY